MIIIIAAMIVSSVSTNGGLFDVFAIIAALASVLFMLQAYLNNQKIIKKITKTEELDALGRVYCIEDGDGVNSLASVLNKSRIELSKVRRIGIQASSLDEKSLEKFLNQLKEEKSDINVEVIGNLNYNTSYFEDNIDTYFKDILKSIRFFKTNDEAHGKHFNFIETNCGSVYILIDTLHIKNPKIIEGKPITFVVKSNNTEDCKSRFEKRKGKEI